MKRHVYYSCLLLCVLSVTGAKLHAQWSAGIGAGVSTNYLPQDVSNRVYTRYTGVSGITIELPVQYRVNNWLALQAAPSLIQKGYKMERFGYYAGVYQTNYNNYLQLPLMVRFILGEGRLRAGFNLGGYGAYWYGGYVKGTMPNVYNLEPFPFETQEQHNILEEVKPTSYEGRYHFDSRKDRRFEWGLLAGAGLSYQLNSKYQLYSEGRYSQSLTDQQKNYYLGQTARYNKTFCITAGIMRRIGKRPSVPHLSFH